MARVCRSPPDRVPTSCPGSADGDADLGHLGHGDAAGLVDIEPAERSPALGRLGADEEVAADAHQGQDREVLVDGRDTPVEGVPG